MSDERLDVVTRALAALAIGEIGCRDEERSGLDPHTVDALIDATSPDMRAGVRQAAVRALGRARVTDAVETLGELRDSDPDPVVQFLAAQALTRITGTDHLDALFRDDLVDRYLDRAHGYELIEVTP